LGEPGVVTQQNRLEIAVHDRNYPRKLLGEGLRGRDGFPYGFALSVAALAYLPRRSPFPPSRNSSSGSCSSCSPVATLDRELGVSPSSTRASRTRRQASASCWTAGDASGPFD